MRLIISLLFLFLMIGTAQAGDYLRMPIDEIHDGDTIKTHFSSYRLPPPLNQVSIRVNGIDTPEMPADSYQTTGKLGRAKCDQEAQMALAAKQAVVDLAKDRTTMDVYNYQHDKYGGRILADVKIGGVSVAEHLITLGLAVDYHGETKTTDWCTPGIWEQ